MRAFEDGAAVIRRDIVDHIDVVKHRVRSIVSIAARRADDEKVDVKSAPPKFTRDLKRHLLHPAEFDDGQGERDSPRACVGATRQNGVVEPFPQPCGEQGEIGRPIVPIASREAQRRGRSQALALEKVVAFDVLCAKSRRRRS